MHLAQCWSCLRSGKDTLLRPYGVFTAVLWKHKKLPRKRKYFLNKSANVKSIKPQLVSPEAQQRQCQSYTKNKISYQTLIMLLYRLTWKLINLLLKKKCLQGVQKWLPITLLKSKLRSSNPFGNLTNEDRRQIAGESRQKLRVLTA